MSADVLWRELPGGDRGPRAAGPATSATAAPAEATSGAAGARSPRRRFWPRGLAFNDRDAIGLRRDLGRAVAAPSAGMPVNIIEIDGRELADLLAETGERAHATAAMACRHRRLLAQRRIGRCFVAMASGAQPCFVQFLLDHTDNQALRQSFGDAFPHLMRDEALLDGAFTPATFSAERVMPAAMARIAARAEAQGVRFVHSFVPVDDPAALRATIAAGFAIHQWRRERWQLWRRRTSFGPLPDDLDLRLG
jgi:hypothetical protein